MFQITIKAARVNIEMRLTDAAEQVGVTEEVLRNYERGRTVIPAYVLKRCAKVYGIPEEYIRATPHDSDEEFAEGVYFSDVGNEEVCTVV